MLKWGDNPEEKGSWEPLISYEKFKELQKILGNKSKPRRYSQKKGYKGLMLCAHCGCAITCTHKIKNGKSYFYYHCTKRRGACDQPYIREEELENQLYEHISKIKIDKRILNKCLEMIKERNQRDIMMYQESKNDKHKRTNEIEQKLSTLMEMRLEQEITKVQYQFKKSELEMELKELKSIQDDSSFNREAWIENMESFFETCFKIEDIFDKANIEERSKLIQALGKNLTVENGIVRWNFRSPWSVMLTAGKDAKSTIWSE